MPRNRPSQRRDLRATTPPMSLRAGELARLQHALERLHSPRLHMSLIVSMTGAIGFLSSGVLLHSGVDQLWLRYPLAVAIAYAGFLLLLWCWLRLKLSDVLDGTDFPFDGPSRGSRHGCSAGHSSGGGSHGSGGGGHGSGGGGHGDATFAVDFGDAVIVVLCIAALGCAVWMAYWTILSAPALFAELMFDSALAAGLYHHLSHTPRRDWLHTALRRTASRFALVAVVYSVAGIAMHVYAPEASSIGQVMHHHKSMTSQHQYP